MQTATHLRRLKISNNYNPMCQYTGVNVSLPGAPLIHLHLRVFMNSTFVLIFLKGEEKQQNKQTKLTPILARARD